MCVAVWVYGMLRCVFSFTFQCQLQLLLFEQVALFTLNANRIIDGWRGKKKGTDPENGNRAQVVQVPTVQEVKT